MTHISLISRGLAVSREQEHIREQARQSTCELAQQHRALRRELLDGIRCRGHIVNASIHSVCEFTGISHIDLDRNAYGHIKHALWKKLDLWLDLNCQGSSMVLNMVHQWQVDLGNDNAAIDTTMHSGMTDSSSCDSDIGMYIGVDQLYDMRQSGNALEVAMASEGISVWFELPSDAAKFKLAWA